MKNVFDEILVSSKKQSKRLTTTVDLKAIQRHVMKMRTSPIFNFDIPMYSEYTSGLPATFPNDVVKLPFPVCVLHIKWINARLDSYVLLEETSKGDINITIIQYNYNHSRWDFKEGSYKLSFLVENDKVSVSGKLFNLGKAHEELPGYTGDVEREYALMAPFIIDIINKVNRKRVVVEREPSQVGKGFKMHDDHVYHLVVIDPSKERYTSSPNKRDDVDHDPVMREHDRRGFWRVSVKGKRHWVNATTVNKGVAGKVKKEYQIQE